jgi:hypothetical protein
MSIAAQWEENSSDNMIITSCITQNIVNKNLSTKMIIDTTRRGLYNAQYPIDQ